MYGRCSTQTSPRCSAKWSCTGLPRQLLHPSRRSLIGSSIICGVLTVSSLRVRPSMWNPVLSRRIPRLLPTPSAKPSQRSATNLVAPEQVPQQLRQPVIGQEAQFRRLTAFAGTCGPRRALPSVPVVFPPRILRLAKEGRFPPTRAPCGTLSGRFRALRSHCAIPLGEELRAESLQTVVLGAELFRSGTHGTVSMAPPHEGGELRLVGVVAGREGVDAARSVGA